MHVNALVMRPFRLASRIFLSVLSCKWYVGQFFGFNHRVGMADRRRMLLANVGAGCQRAGGDCAGGEYRRLPQECIPVEGISWPLSQLSVRAIVGPGERLGDADHTGSADYVGRCETVCSFTHGPSAQDWLSGRAVRRRSSARRSVAWFLMPLGGRGSWSRSSLCWQCGQYRGKMTWSVATCSRVRGLPSNRCPAGMTQSCVGHRCSAALCDCLSLAASCNAWTNSCCLVNAAVRLSLLLGLLQLL